MEMVATFQLPVLQPILHARAPLGGPLGALEPLRPVALSQMVEDEGVGSVVLGFGVFGAPRFSVQRSQTL